MTTGHPACSDYSVGCRPKLAALLDCLGLGVSYTRATGVWLHRSDGMADDIAVLDLVGGFGAGLLGHNPPELKELITQRLAEDVPFLAQCSNRAAAGRLAARLNAAIPGDRPYICHLSNSGAEAMEAALKHAYKVRFDAIRRLLEQVARETETFYRTIERDHPDIAIPGAAGDLGRFRDDIDEHNIAELERFRRGPVVLALKGGFHGKTASALKVTFNKTYREGFDGLSAIQPVFLDDSDVERLDAICSSHVVTLLQPRLEDRTIVVERVTTSGVIALCLEVIQGEGGMRVVADRVLAGLAAAHGTLGVPYVIDEIQTGCGRTGSFLGFSRTPLATITPEYLLLSKALGGGLVKVAATLILEDVYDPTFGVLHTSTFAEDDLGCEVAARVVDILLRDDGEVMRQVEAKGDRLLRGLRALQARFPDVVRDVRGRGLMIGLEFTDLLDKGPLFRFGIRQGFLSLLVASYLLHHRQVRLLAPLTTLMKGNPGRQRASVIRIQPAVGITDAEIDDVLDALAEVFNVIAHNNEGMLIGHLLGMPATSIERRHPTRIPVTFPGNAQTEAFDARIGFVVHPAHVDQLLEYYLPSLVGRVDPASVSAWWSSLSPFLDADLIHTAYTSSDGFVVQSNVVAVPYLPADLVTAYRAGRAPTASRSARLRLEEITDRIQDAVTVARELGDGHIPTSVVGLGAFTSIVSDRGTTLNDFEVPITTGNAYTSGLMIEGIEHAAASRGLTLSASRAAVVGAAGNIGSVLATIMAVRVGEVRLVGRPGDRGFARLMATRSACLAHIARRIRTAVRAAGSIESAELTGLPRRMLDEIVLPGIRSRSGTLPWHDGADWLRGHAGDDAGFVRLLEAAIDRMGGPSGNRYLTVHLDVGAVTDCDIVMIATNSPEGRLVTPDLVRHDAIVACASVPSNLAPEFYADPGDRLVFDGGYARLPEGQVIDCVGLPKDGLAFGCFSETLMLGFEGIRASYAKGPLTPQLVEETLEMAARHGFTLGDLKHHPGVRRPDTCLAASPGG